jgi:tRNA (Thr-GGU) A37 N-methylase
MDFVMTPIGYVRGGREAVEDDAWGSVTCRIELDGLATDALVGLDAFSHVEVLFVFDRVDPASVCRGARRPRGRQDWPLVGIFAQRAKDRPNRIGSTVCEVVGLDGAAVEVRGLDAVAGTPVLDLKPYLAGFAPRGDVREPAWSRELMAGYW